MVLDRAVNEKKKCDSSERSVNSAEEGRRVPHPSLGLVPICSQ